nr:CbrC family protein [uncultured Campylobacter sp.]
MVAQSLANLAKPAKCGSQPLTKANARGYLVTGGDTAGYLFRCTRCGKYKIQVDAS